MYNFECLDKNHVMLTSLALTRMAGAAGSQPNVSNNAAWLAVSPEIGPQFRWAPISRTRGWKPSPDFRQNPSTGNRCPIWAAPGRNRACHLSVASLCAFGWPARPYIFICYMAIAPGPGPTEAKIQNSKTGRLDFGFWSLDFGFWILDFGFWSLDWILEFGFWISLVFVLLVAAPNGLVWILDFGFWILDFGFWVLDFGLWILEFGFGFGFWSLDFGFWAWIRIDRHRLDPA